MIGGVCSAFCPAKSTGVANAPPTSGALPPFGQTPPPLEVFSSSSIAKTQKVCYYAGMNTKKTRAIPHKLPVTEQEFLTHLAVVCPDNYVRRIILAYYKKLKAFDTRHSKQISIQTYGFVPFCSIFGDNLPDQAKYLFGASCVQKTIVNLVEKLGDKTCQILNKTKHLNIIKQNLIATRNAYLQHFLNKHSTHFIGKADLFRWQFVNFIRQVETTNQNLYDGIGSINFIKRQMTIHNIKPLQSLNSRDKIFEKHYTDKVTVFHELTHLISVKTFENGKYNYFLNREFQDQYGMQTALPVFLNASTNKSEALQIYSDGLTLLIELATELFTSVCISDITSAKNICFFENFQNCPSVQTVHLKTINDNNYVVHSEYQYFGHILELIFILNNLDNFDKISPCNVPTQNIINVVENFFEQGKLSPDIAQLVDTQIAKKFIVQAESLKNANNFDKFILLMGYAYRTFNTSLVDLGYLEKTQNLNSAYNKTAMILQAMVLDIHKNKFEMTLSKIQDNPNATKKYLSTFSRLASFADDWIIKPNTKFQNLEKYLRDELSTINLAEFHPDNIALKTWGDFLKIIISKNQKFAPEILEKSKFLSSETKYLKNKENCFEK